MLEIITPTLLTHPTLDSNIDSIRLTTNQKFTPKEYYLHTSPELEMKKLLATHQQSIYQLSTVYRDNEIGEHNFNEFLMLEYYLTGVDMMGLTTHVCELLHTLGIQHAPIYKSYDALMREYAGVSVHASLIELTAHAKHHGLTTKLDLTDLQILLWVHFVEPHLHHYPLLVVTDFPCEQSAYAKVTGATAKRFEIYLAGSEIANGYEELQAYEEYLSVFTKQAQESGHPINTEFLEYIKHTPLPQCSGVAIGLERLFNRLNN